MSAEPSPGPAPDAARQTVRTRGSWLLPRLVIGLLVVAVVGGLTALLVMGEPDAIAMSMAVRVDGRTVTVGGNADLPEGSLLQVSLYNLDRVNEPRFDARVTVSTKKYEHSTGVPATWAGDILVVVAFVPGLEGQPSVLTEAYGETGERLRGGRITRSSDSGESYFSRAETIYVP